MLSTISTSTIYYIVILSTMYFFQIYQHLPATPPDKSKLFFFIPL